MSTTRTRSRWSHRLGWLLGGFLVALGAVSGTFGTVAWLAVLCVPTFSSFIAGLLGLGVAPVVAGGALLWSGLRVLERQGARSRVYALPDQQIIAATQDGATVELVAARLGVLAVQDLTDRLDQLAAREVLDLQISEDGALLYSPRASP